MALKDIDFANEIAIKKELLVEMRKSAQPFSLLLQKTARTPAPSLFVVVVVVVVFFSFSFLAVIKSTFLKICLGISVESK